MISNARQEYISFLVILKLVDDSANPNYVICLGDVLDRNIDLNIVKEVCSERS